MKITFSIPPSEIRAMLHLTSEDDTRFILCGIHFDISPDQILLVATDGRLLGVLKTDAKPVFTDGEPRNVQFTLNRDYLSTAAGPPVADIEQCDKCGAPPLSIEPKLCFVVDITDEALPAVGILSGEIELRSNGMDGTYPMWRMVVPTEFPSGAVNVNLNLLDAFRSVLTELRANSRTARIRGGGSAAFQISLPDLPNFFGLLMPTADYGNPALTVPSWLQLPTLESPVSP